MSVDALAATQPLPRVIPAGIGATFYGSLPRDLDTPLGREVIRACDLVTLHTAADAGDVQSAALVRQLGCERVWLAIPANYLSRLDLRRGRAAVLDEVRRVAEIATRMGAEVLELNGEGASDGATEGDWTHARTDDRERARLEGLARDVFVTLREALPCSIALAWTSHDMPAFRVPWGPILSRVDLHAPQHYPAMPGVVATQRTLDRRIATSRGRWEALVARGEIPADVAPYGARWSPYLQGHGHSVGALVWGLCEAPVARLWACPNSWSAEAVVALRAARVLRGAAGHGPVAVERWQASHGLDADGIVGPVTLRTLGVTA